jgi:folylpolyglutamate synthase/dihydrofolate synthase
MDQFEYLDSLGQFTIRPGLSRMNRAMTMLDNPHLCIPSVLVAGTNGKGAVCHMADAALSSFPLKRVLYTSPHLRSVTERILIDSKEVGRELLGSHIGKIRALTDERSIERLTYFETITAACFSMLPRSGADVLVSEVGLGGRWDATNILEPQACAISSISLDHTDLLGEDVVSIATEKAGIIKPSTPLVLGPLLGCGEERTRCIRTILDICSRNGSPVVLICREGENRRMSSMLEEQAVPDWRMIEVTYHLDDAGTSSKLKVMKNPDLQNSEPRFRLLDNVLDGTYRTPLLGGHQSFNTACALSLALLVLPSALARSRLKLNMNVPLEDLVEGCVDKVEEQFDCRSISQMLSEGLDRTRMMGRMERKRYKGSTIYLDGGHNVEAGSSIASTIRELHPGKKVVLLFSQMRDKDPANYLRNLSGMVSKAIITELPQERGMPLSMLRQATILGLGNDIPITALRDREKAMVEFLRALEGDTVGLICGSFYLYDIFIGNFE